LKLKRSAVAARRLRFVRRGYMRRLTRVSSKFGSKKCESSIPGAPV